MCEKDKKHERPSLVFQLWNKILEKEINGENKKKKIPVSISDK